MLSFIAFSLALSSCSAKSGVTFGPEKVFNDAGYIPVASGTKELFYWFFESRNDPTTDPFIIWMSGGPGCSSQLAMFAENGPYHVNKKAGGELYLTLNEFSWNSNATVLWIDQPAGAGFSYGVPDFGEKGVANDMWSFLMGFYKKYPKYQGLDLHIFGESYAGHYVPATAAKIIDNIAAGMGEVNLKSIAIGNGLTAPGVQFEHYLPYAKAHNLVDKGQAAIMAAVLPVCEALTFGCNKLNGSDATNATLKWAACLNAYTFCAFGELVPVQSTGVNLYDVREKCEHPPLCYDFSDVTTYLNQPDVKQALGVKKKWSSCNRLVDMEFVYGGDWMLSFASDVAKVLDSGRRALVYVGEEDFICNWMGNDAWTRSLKWSGKEQFNIAQNTTWTSESGVTAGSYRSAKGLTFLKVKGAGHLVPHDQPENSLDMVIKHIQQAFD
mmetsp:Transcript_8398/g.16277  ORF Transcript_8398/g.16277 Transcript_8398/m.16277 type:complete len:439 (-) Transcript_8398:353-1669(-)